MPPHGCPTVIGILIFNITEKMKYPKKNKKKIWIIKKLYYIKINNFSRRLLQTQETIRYKKKYAYLNRQAHFLNNDETELFFLF